MVFVGPCLLNVFCVFMCVYVCVRAPVCGCTHKKEVRGVGDKGQCWETSSVTLHLIFLRQVFSLNLKLANSARLAGPASPTHLPVSTTLSWDSRHTSLSQFLPWMLGVCTWVLTHGGTFHLNHLSRPVSHMPAAAFKNYWKLNSSSLYPTSSSSIRGIKKVPG